MTENESARYNELKAKIAQCVEHSYVIPDKVPIPFEGSVIVEQVKQQEVKTLNGIILTDTEARNVLRPNIGIIIAVGPKVPDYLVPKLRVYFNQNIDLEYLFGGRYYKMSHYSDFYCAIPENVLVSMDTKDDKELTREDLVSRDENYQKNSVIKSAEELDAKEIEQKLKTSKNFIIKGKA